MHRDLESVSEFVNLSSNIKYNKMKKLLKFLFLTLLLVNCTMAQNTDIGTTTDQEYKYLTVSYPAGLAYGAQILEGYTLEPWGKPFINKYSIEPFKFIKKETGKVHAILFVCTKEKGKEDKKQIVVLPFNNVALIEDYVAATEKLGISMKIVFDNYIAYIFSSIANQYLNHPNYKAPAEIKKN